MAILGLRLSGVANGVSQMHGQVARDMWAGVWPGAPASEVPIRSITNGVHVRSWLSTDMAELFDRYLGPDWSSNPVDKAVWQRVSEVPEAELWRAHERRRQRLVAVARQRLRQQLRRAGAPPAEIKSADEVLDAEALTIGFARRFAPYKRANLILRDKDRLARILTNPKAPVQIIFAGKAHPQDNRGKELVKDVIAFARRPEMRRHVVFLEDYDMNIARYLVQGVDVWLNTPKPLHEASGTSGMKVPPNGGINMSVLDGWWHEGWDGENGWAIGDGRIYEDEDYQNHVEAESVYDLMEKELVPLFYERGADDIPRRWVGRMKASMQSISPLFSANRMVVEYVEQLYSPAARRWKRLEADDFAAGKELAEPSRFSLVTGPTPTSITACLAYIRASWSFAPRLIEATFRCRRGCRNAYRRRIVARVTIGTGCKLHGRARIDQHTGRTPKALSKNRAQAEAQVRCF